MTSEDRCEAKQVYVTARNAEIAAGAVNWANGSGSTRRHAAGPLVPYRCQVCDCWHLTTARSAGDLARAAELAEVWTT